MHGELLVRLSFDYFEGGSTHYSKSRVGLRNLVLSQCQCTGFLRSDGHRRLGDGGRGHLPAPKNPENIIRVYRVKFRHFKIVHTYIFGPKFHVPKVD